ncbi:hypothetical protein NQ314_010763 [Rhamnusium bicolor]|uniref:TATA element modulatory factor n=1 Tax=Rhamnusium bicolor TaxID=1586634 RepID=A0AAV8XNT9_9CUCU|nr:hypothetical protein NQ314_010763 [Rhamnusium bicolor]
MSWFDAAGLANIAKSALKEAQKTIDKALDIKEDPSVVPTNTPVDTNSEDFFGSFFDTAKGNVKTPSIDSLEDTSELGAEHFNQNSTDNLSENVSNATTVKRRDKPTSYTNRLSIISSESGKNSSESVDIITCSTECTTSPDSDVLSLGLSVSTSSSALVRLEKISPESVEVIQEDQDENSIADDTMSYTSISESTSATVLDSAFNLHLKPQKMLKDTFNRPEAPNESIASDLSLSPEKTYSFTDAITRAPSRSNMHLPLTQVNQVLIDTQPQSNKQDMSNILQKTNIIDIPQESDINTSSGSETQLDISTDDGSQSDKTIIGSDNIMESSSDTSTTTETSSHSTYLKNMLADAMTEKHGEQQKSQFMYLTNDTAVPSNKSCLLESISISQLDMPPRENSPVSSESRSDLVKIGSDHTSGHTSGDELETTTSSDIEIISSPNGDSSSTQSRQSPAKQTSKMSIKKAKGHTRELSEASSISDDSHSSEIDRLLKRLSEMTDILESRESKLIDINRRNAELQDMNNSLKLQLDLVITKQLESADLSQVTEEYTQRLSALEKNFNRLLEKKDTLRKQLEQAKQEAATRMSKGELEALITEKEDVIKELREEGEKLSKQQLQHFKDKEEIIKLLYDKIETHENKIEDIEITTNNRSNSSSGNHAKRDQNMLTVNKMDPTRMNYAQTLSRNKENILVIKPKNKQKSIVTKNISVADIKVAISNIKVTEE